MCYVISNVLGVMASPTLLVPHIGGRATEAAFGGLRILGGMRCIGKTGEWRWVGDTI